MPKEIGRTPEEAEFWSSVDIAPRHWYYVGEREPGVRNSDIRNRAWSYVYAPIPNGYFVELWCDDDNCVRPQHMFIGKLDEAAYAVARRQEKKRESHIELRDRRKKVSDEDIIEIKYLASQGMNHAEIGRLFGISRDLANKVVKDQKRTAKADPITGRVYQRRKKREDWE